MAYVNLPGTFPTFLDGNLAVVQPNGAPRTLILGTAAQGLSGVLFQVRSPSSAASEFGKEGNLIRGMYEALAQGAENVFLMRIGGTNVVVEHIGDNLAAGGYSISPSLVGDEGGSRFAVFYDDSADLLMVWDNEDEAWVWSNDPTSPIDFGLVSVSGSRSATGSLDIGTASAPVNLEDIPNQTDIVTGPGTASSSGVTVTVSSSAGMTIGDTVYSDGQIRVVASIPLATTFTTNTAFSPALSSDTWTYGPAISFTAGDDGVGVSQMETYEALYNAYELLDFQKFDVVVPMDVYANSVNVVDLSSGEITSRGLPSVSDYPTAGTAQDVLGKVYIQRYQGKNYFWWDVDNDATDADSTSTTDPAAEIFPTVGSADHETNADGTTLTAADFHAVDFGHQLATFCYNATENYQACLGVIGVTKPSSLGLADVAAWVGMLPEYTVDPLTLEQTVAASADNGTGLLGIKWLAGKNGFRSSVKDGGYILTDNGFPDGVEQMDANDHLVDLGKYISVVGAWVIHSNAFDTTGRGYVGSFAAGYGGFITTLAVASGPTNKVVKRVRLPYRLPASVLDETAGVRLVMLAQKTKGICVTDAPTAARPDSDYTRLTTVRIVADTVQKLRDASDPFLGEPISTPQIAAFNTAIEQTLNLQKQQGKLRDFRFNLTITPQMAVVGTAQIDMILVPAFELRRVLVTTSLAAEIG